VQKVQESENMPSLTKECRTFMLHLGLPNCLKEDFSQLKWKMLVKKAILEKNESEIREAMQSKNKLKERKICLDNYEMKRTRCGLCPAGSEGILDSCVVRDWGTDLLFATNSYHSLTNFDFERHVFYIIITNT
jgi:hypothetical protein